MKFSKKLKDESDKKWGSYRSQSIGTEHYYRWWVPSLVITDGVKVMVEELGCAWLIDMVASHLPIVVKDYKATEGGLYVIDLIKNVDDGNGAGFYLTDGDYRDIAYQEVEFTSIKTNVRMFLQTDTERWVLMCTSEY